MATEITFSGDVGPVEKELDRIVKETEKAAKEMNKSFSKVGKDKSFGERINGKLSGFKKGLAAGGVNGGQLGNLGGMAKVGKLGVIAAGVAMAWKLVTASFAYFQDKQKDAIRTNEDNLKSIARIVEERKRESAEINKSVDALSKYAEKAKLSNEEQVKAEIELKALKKKGVEGAYINGDSMTGFADLQKNATNRESSQRIAELKRQENIMREQMSQHRELAGKNGYFRDVSDRFFGTSYIKDANASAEAMSELADKIREVALERQKLEKENSGPEQKERIKNETAILQAKLADMQEANRQKDADSGKNSMTDAEKLLALEKEIAEEKAKIAEAEEKNKKDLEFLKDEKLDKDYIGYAKLENQIMHDTLLLEMKRDKIRDKEREHAELLAKQEKSIKKHTEEQAKGLRLQVLEAAGLKKQAALEKALDDARKAKGADLTAEETARVGKLAEIQQMVDSMPERKTGMDTKTNELTARGGFISAGVSSHDRQMREQNAIMKRQATLLGEIKEKLNELGIVL